MRKLSLILAFLFAFSNIHLAYANDSFQDFISNGSNTGIKFGPYNSLDEFRKIYDDSNSNCSSSIENNKTIVICQSVPPPKSQSASGDEPDSPVRVCQRFPGDGLPVVGARDEAFDSAVQSGAKNCKKSKSVDKETHQIARHSFCCDKQDNHASSGGGADIPCDQEAENLKQTCSDKAKTAESDCDPEGGTMGAATRTLEAASGLMQQMANSNVALACSKMNAAMAGVKAALGLFETNCTSSRKNCMDSCDSARVKFEACKKDNVSKGVPGASETQVPQEITDNKNNCNGYHSRKNAAIESIAGVGQSMATAKACEQYASSGDLPNPAAQEMCKADPTAPGCGGPDSCSNPKFAATSTVCICLTNPNDSRCGGSLAGGPGSNKIGGSPGGGAGLLNGAGGAANGFAGENLGGPMLPGIAGMPGDQGKSEDPGGKKGAGAPLPGGGHDNGGKGDREPVYGKDKNGNAVITGWRGGGSGGSGAYGGSGGNRNPGSANEGLLKPGDKFDPNKYKDGIALPGSFVPGMSGMTGPDGITGQHDDIFKKIKNRYNAKAFTLR